ncbi:MAG: CRISPR-associated endonuclease Cas1 [Planctomycetes bacterium]|nr:CRISPR-associated endonuclease Cas1 [Planctomycetota bacterium]
MDDMRFYRIRIILKLTQAASLPSHHAGVLYAVLSSACGQSHPEGPVLPDGLMLDAPEQCRIRLEQGDLYAFGFTLIAPGLRQAGAIVWQAVRGLRQLGAHALPTSAKLAGNFHVVRVEDLVTGRKLAEDEYPSPMPQSSLDRQIERLQDTEVVTLRFTSPLRLKRPSSRRRPGHMYFDSECFDPVTFLTRLDRRLETLGFAGRADGIDPSMAQSADNGLVWLDLAYGPPSLRKTLGGSVGRVRLHLSGPGLVRSLVLGQYAHLGENTRFGFGRYAIEELGPDPYECRRSLSLTRYCLISSELDVRAAELDLPSGAARETVRVILQGRYQPGPCMAVTIHEQRDRTRQLAIPSYMDRVLQRVIVDRLGPALNMLFEESSMAYRKGLGRGKAAERIRDAYRQGYRYGLRTDFGHFFDSIDHEQLRRRLDAYIADDDMVKLIMMWVEKGAPAPGRGLPTGAPLSPLLSNLFLDSFDEQIAAAGAFLVRYADDFLMLFRTEQEALHARTAAQEIAEHLLLTLNEDKTVPLDLAEPFEFLGYRFERQERWEIRGDNPPRRMEDLGWHDSRTSSPSANAAVPLPGEQEQVPARAAPVVVFGPGVAMLKTVDGRLVCSYVDGRGEQSTELAQVGAVVVLGRTTIAGTALHRLIQEDIPVLLASDSGSIAGTFAGTSDLEDPQTVAAQVLMAQNEPQRLALARTLIGAKLRNYAALARSLEGGRAGASLADGLTELAMRLPEAGSTEQILGLEGAGAARWYRSFDGFLPQGYHFERRVAPDARDPVNVMLNIAHTALYRQLILLVRQAGLVPSLGVMHTSRPGCAALACDLQEPFRHLMDLVVLLAAREIDPKAFRRTSRGPFALEIQPQAARRLYAIVWTILARYCQSRHGGEVRSYLMWMTSAARGLRRHLGDPAQPLEVFEHP